MLMNEPSRFDKGRTVQLKLCKTPYRGRKETGSFQAIGM